MARRSRRRREEEHPDERWLVTYADVLTLMFVLFMVLFAMSIVNTSKFEALKGSLRDAFSASVSDGGTSVMAEAARIAGLDTPPMSATIAPAMPSIGGPSSDLSHTPAAQALENRQLEVARKAIEAAVARAGMRHAVTTRIDNRGLVVRVATDGVLFDSGSAQLRPEGQRLLAPISGALRTLPNPVRVEGHTDTNPISTPVHPSNWELSGARASAVVRRLAVGGITGRRMEVSGFGSTRPTRPNATAAGRAANRRVVVIVERLQQNTTPAPKEAPVP